MSDSIENLIDKKMIYSSDLTSFKRTIKDYKLKLKENNLNPGDKAEIDLWILFASLNPISISNANVMVGLNSGKGYEIDILVIFNEAIFVIECKEGKSHIISKEIAYTSSNKTDIQNKIKSNLKIKHTNFVFINYYSDKVIEKEDFALAKQKNIIILSAKHLEFYNELVLHLKDRAKEIIFSDLLVGKKWVDAEGHSDFIHVPVLKAIINGIEIFHFLVTPAILKKICYVHRRNMQFSLDEEDVSYQRIIETKRLRDIKDFIIEGGIFPTSVLLNFKKQLTFERGHKSKYSINQQNIDFGYLRLPKEYGYSSIIDGQHRIYGYSGLDDKSEKGYLSVIAFNNIESKKQAELFVQINQNQKSVNKDIIWDLYTQLEDEESENYVISWLIKELNKKNKLLKDSIYIPYSSKRPKKEYEIFIGNMASSLKKNKDIIKIGTLSDKRIDKKIIFTLYDEFFNQLAEREEITNRNISNIFLRKNTGISIAIYFFNYFYNYLTEKKVDYHIKLATNRINEILHHLKEFTDVLTEVLERETKENLKIFIEQPGEGTKIKNTKYLIFQAAKGNDTFKELSAGEFIEDVEEDETHEFKSSIIWNDSFHKKDEVMFAENILGTIVAFINSNLEGNLYLGVDNNKHISGLEGDLKLFNNSFDQLKLYILDRIRDRIITSNYDVQTLVNIHILKKDPLALHIRIKQNNNSPGPVVAFVIGQDKKPLIYLKRDASKENISKNYTEYLIENKGDTLKKMIGEYFMELQMK